MDPAGYLPDAGSDPAAGAGPCRRDAWLSCSGSVFQQKKQPRELPLERFWLVSRAQDPGRAILFRALLAIGLVLIVTLITYIDRYGYLDSNNPDHTLTFLDSLYYATVTITTTGYGDLVPSSEFARLISAILVTPLRVLFLVLLVGTTLEALTTQSRKRAKVKARQKEWKGHTIIAGFGVKGRSALEYLRKHDIDTLAIIIDDNKEVLRRAESKQRVDGIEGKAFDRDTLDLAGIHDARKLIIALNTDEHALLTVLRARELNPELNIVVSCRKEENQELLKRSGADEVIVSASSAGRILGMAADAPDAAKVVNDLLTFGDGLDIDDRVIERDGEDIAKRGQTPIAVIRYRNGNQEGRVLRPGFDEDVTPLRKGDRIVFIATRKDNEIVVPPKPVKATGPVKVTSATDDPAE